MEKYLSKSFEAEKYLFNESINVLYKIDRGLSTGYEGQSIELIYESAYLSGAFGSWLKYSEETTYHRIINNRIGAYMASLKGNQLTDIEFTKAFFYVIKRNIASGIFLPNPIFSKLDNASRSTQFEIQSLLDSSNCKGNYFLPFIDSFFTKIFVYPKLYEKEDNELFCLLTSDIKDINLFIESHHLLKNYYLDKEDSFTEEDISYILPILDNLELDEESISKIERGLHSMVYRRNSKKAKQEKATNNPNIPIKKVHFPKKEALSKREYYSIESELSTYFSFEKMIAPRALSLKEVIYCIKLMLKLQKPEHIIDSFIREVEKRNSTENRNPVSLYIELYDKIKYYAQSESIARKIALVEEYLSEIFICQDNDYEFWKEMIDEELTSLLSELPNNGEYEKQQAKLLK